MPSIWNPIWISRVWASRPGWRWRRELEETAPLDQGEHLERSGDTAWCHSVTWYIRPISPAGWDRFNLLSVKDGPDFVKDVIISILTPDAHCLLLCRQQSLQLFNAVPRDEIISHVEDDVSDGSYRRQTGQSYVDLIWSLWIQNCQNLHFSQGDDRVLLSWRQQDVHCTAGCTMYSRMYNVHSNEMLRFTWRLFNFKQLGKFLLVKCDLIKSFMYLFSFYMCQSSVSKSCRS